MGKTMRVSDEAHEQLKQISDEQDEPMADVVDALLGEDLKLASGKQERRKEIADYLVHLSSETCNSEVCEKLREDFGLKSSADLKSSAKKSDTVGFCPYCGKRFTKQDVREPMFGEAVVDHKEDDCSEDWDVEYGYQTVVLKVSDLADSP